MKYTSKSCVLIVAVTLAALALRLPYLAQRPMHGDVPLNPVPVPGVTKLV